jgi:hypothetical protein
VNILCDFHHSDLWWSHHLIFEKALGHKLFRPRGMEWFSSGYYQQKSKEVAKQFLVDSMFTVAQVAQHREYPVGKLAGIHRNVRASMDTVVGSDAYPLMQTLSLEEFGSIQIDVIMATTSDMQEPWVKLKKDRKPKARLVREEGNIIGWATLHPEYKNILTSDLPSYLNADAPNKLLYHQKFDVDGLFRHREPKVFNRITCFMPGFRVCPELVKLAERNTPDGMEFRDYGHHSKLGFISTKEKFVGAMAETSFVWHVKPGGDGFGHVLHNSIAMGRPVITRIEDYNRTQALPLLLDRKTCILLGGDVTENKRKIVECSSPERLLEMSRSAASRFRSVVDYEWEASEIGRFLDRLV